MRTWARTNRKPHCQQARVILRLRHALGQRHIPRLGLDDGEPGVAVLQHIVGRQRLATLARTLDASQGDGKLAPDAAALNHVPTGCLEGGVDMLGAGFGFIYV